MSSKNLALSVRGLSKAYTIAHQQDKQSTLAETLLQRARHLFQTAPKERFWALKDVSFDIKKGEVVGIIGRNGAGKSTLLKILSRITEPTEGRIDSYGRIGSLLEVGTGFHPELTGRENIFLNGAVLGMRKAEIHGHFDAIVEFSGVESFLDTPVKRYSSGMYVRLAFAVAAHLNPEILIVDEVLAVGDAEFQKKCLGKMKDVASTGRTIFFVSHNIAAVANICSSLIMLGSGKLLYQGNVNEGIARYSQLSDGNGSPQEMGAYRKSSFKKIIKRIRLLNSKGNDCTQIIMGSPLSVELEFDVGDEPPLRQPVMGVIISHATLGVVAGVNTRMTGYWPEPALYRIGTFRCELPKLTFLQGRYTFEVWLGDGVTDVDAIQGYLALDIEETDIYQSGKIPYKDMGAIFLQPKWVFAGDGTAVSFTSVN